LVLGYSGGGGWTPTPEGQQGQQHVGQLRVEVAALHAELEVGFGGGGWEGVGGGGGRG
jgi:hypothetical protein